MSDRLNILLGQVRDARQSLEKLPVGEMSSIEGGSIAIALQEIRVTMAECTRALCGALEDIDQELARARRGDQ